MEHTISSDKGKVTFDLDNRTFSFEMAKGWSGRGEISAMSGNAPGPEDDLRVHNWAGQTPDQAFSVSFQYVGETEDGGKNIGFDYVANVTRQENAKTIQIFGDVATLPRPAKAAPASAEPSYVQPSKFQVEGGRVVALIGQDGKTYRF